MARIHERGQLTLPKAMREQVGLSAGDDVTIVVRGDELVIRKASNFLDARLPRGTRRYDAAEEKRAYAEAVAADPVNRRANDR